MQLTTKGRYAVMAMVDVARHGAGRAVSLAEIAARQDISLSYLEQLFARLRRAGLVKSVRGPGGGYRLSRAAAALSVSDIMLAVEEPLKVTRCTASGPGGGAGCVRGERCLTHDLWTALGRQIETFLGAVSLQDVLDGRLDGAPRMEAAAA